VLKSFPLYSQQPNPASEDCAGRVCVARTQGHHASSKPAYPPLHGPVCHEVPSAVLDTNVVLDWLVFNDASCKVLAGQLDAGQLRWHATDAMRAELCSVLPRPVLLAWKPDDEHVLSVFDRLARLGRSRQLCHCQRG